MSRDAMDVCVGLVLGGVAGSVLGMVLLVFWYSRHGVRLRAELRRWNWGFILALAVGVAPWGWLAWVVLR